MKPSKEYCTACGDTVLPDVEASGAGAIFLRCPNCGCTMDVLYDDDYLDN